jgi:hypothetical protein
VRAGVNITTANNMTTTAEDVETDSKGKCCAGSVASKCRGTCSVRQTRRRDYVLLLSRRETMVDAA